MDRVSRQIDVCFIACCCTSIRRCERRAVACQMVGWVREQITDRGVAFVCWIKFQVGVYKAFLAKWESSAEGKVFFLAFVCDIHLGVWFDGRGDVRRC